MRVESELEIVRKRVFRMSGEMIHDEDVARLIGQVFHAFNHVMHGAEQAVEIGATSVANLAGAGFLGCAADMLVDVLQPPIKIEFALHVDEDLETIPRKTGFEGFSMDAEQFECLKGVTEREAVLEINGQLVQRGSNA